MRISDLERHHGRLVECSINNQYVPEALIYFNGAGMYLLQNIAVGASPDNFEDINRTFGTNFTFGYYIGSRSATVPSSINLERLVNTGSIAKERVPVRKFKEGDKFISIDGEELIVFKAFNDKQLIIVKDFRDIVSKMLDTKDLNAKFFDEKEYKPINPKDDMEKFYYEDLFQYMVYKAPPKQAGNRTISQMLADMMREEQLQRATAFVPTPIDPTTERWRPQSQIDSEATTFRNNETRLNVEIPVTSAAVPNTEGEIRSIDHEIFNDFALNPFAARPTNPETDLARARARLAGEIDRARRAGRVPVNPTARNPRRFFNENL